MTDEEIMITPNTLTGTARVWTTSKWHNIDHVDHMIAHGKNDGAVSAMTYLNQDMSGTREWVEVGIAQITVTFHPRAELVAKELDGLKAQLKKVRAENQMRENAILDCISKLTAIEYTAPEEF